MPPPGPPQPLWWTEQELGAHHLFQLVCTFPHADEWLAATWAPKAQEQVENDSQTQNRPTSQPLTTEGCGAGEGGQGCAGGRPVTGTQRHPPHPGWDPSHSSPPSGTLRLQWDRILKRL